MKSDWAERNLQVIRTLMESAAIYRCALAPIMLFNGVIGLAAAVVGWELQIVLPRTFILFWGCIGLLALISSFLLVRRQALKGSAPFWSAPMKRITQALLPPLIAGLILSGVIWANATFASQDHVNVLVMSWLPAVWVILYGFAVHAAGFFMPRGMKLFGWMLLLGGCVLLAVGIPDGVSHAGYAFGVMGAVFGGLHLAYGIYLYFTEKTENAA